MKTLKAFVVAAATVVALSAPAYAQDANKIMTSVFNKKTPKSTKSEMTMVLIGSGGEQRREMKMEQLGDDKSLMWFVTPNDLRGTAMLNISEGDDSKIWLYLPAFKNKQRIAGSKKKDSFMGSDFAYEDMEKRDVSDFKFKYIKADKDGGVDVHVIEGIPTSKDTSYSKVLFYVDVKHEEIVKSEMFALNGEKVKVVEISKMEEIKGYRLPSETTMTDLTRDHKTKLLMKNVQLDVDIPENHFTEAYLSRVN